MYDKVLYGVAGATGAGIMAWKKLFPWIKYDLAVMKIGKHMRAVMDKDKVSGKFLIDIFEEQVANHPKKPFIIFEGNVFTYEYIDLQANRVANVVRSWGLKVGDTVAILIYNEPAFVWTFLGLQKLGIAVAMINFNLQHKQLSHSVRASEAQALIVGAGDELFHAVMEVDDEFGDMPIYFQGLSSNQLSGSIHRSFDDLMFSASQAGFDRSVRADLTNISTGCYIYTSGTTGLPKPVQIMQTRMVGIASVLQLVMFNGNDIIYTTVPLYHSSGSGIGLFGTIKSGATMVLRRKFSAKHFWEDCVRYRVTVIQYIGELFRYLLTNPESPDERRHCIRVAVGNGLRRDIWSTVESRFRIPMLAEFFGATEGTTMLFNISNIPGAVGRLSPLLQKLLPISMHLIKYDVAAGKPLRDEKGRCIQIRPGEKGLFISGITPELIETGIQFYKASKGANESKLIRNVFVDGDMYFNYGDLLFMDKDYFLYFADRIGDTFRWKGENVSTTEVANVLSSLDSVLDANVYGVTIPGQDGRAGMVALTLCDDKSLTPDFLSRLWKHCNTNLASYARPLFIRVQKEAMLTATFKQQKVQMVKEAFDINVVTDPLYFADKDSRTYIPITEDVYSKILTKSKL